MSLRSFIHGDLGYTVRHIATPESELLCWDGSEESRLEAAQKATEDDISFVPVTQNGTITRIIAREDLVRGLEPGAITFDWLIAGNTPIRQVVERFALSPRKDHTAMFLVLESSRIMGLVTPTDLNKVPARASLFLLVAHAESLLTEFIKRHTDDGVIEEYLKEELELIRARVPSEEIGSPGLVHFLTFSEIKKLVERSENLREKLNFTSRNKAKRALEFVNLRNDLAHQNRVFIRTVEDIAYVHNQCNRVEAILERLAYLDQQTEARVEPRD